MRSATLQRNTKETRIGGSLKIATSAEAKPAENRLSKIAVAPVIIA